MKTVKFGYLSRQFSADALGPYLDDLRRFVPTGEFTLGAPLRAFEEAFAAAHGVCYAVGVASGTDALVLSLKALGIKRGDRVLTTPMTFVATVGAIVQAGATPALVDCDDDLLIDPDAVWREHDRKACRAVVPVHYAGNLCDLTALTCRARLLGVPVVEDAAQAVGASLGSKPAGAWGRFGCFSLHPLKNLNVWADGGVITTDDQPAAEYLRLARNHGLLDRDTVAFFAGNARLDTLQALVALRQLPDLDRLTDRRVATAHRYDAAFEGLPGLRTPKAAKGVRHVYHLYILQCDRRDALREHLRSRGVETKIHYPTPVHLQPAARGLGYGPGSFPVCEDKCKRILSLPVHPYLKDDEVEWVIRAVRSFYEPEIF